MGGSITFTSQYGLVDVSTLPVISIDNKPVQKHANPQPEPDLAQENPVNTQNINQEADIFAALEKLAKLKQKGILTDNEYSAKKTELLSRL